MTVMSWSFHRLAKVGFSIVHKTVDEGDVVVRVPVCHQNLCKCSRQYPSITVITGTVKQVCKQLHDGFECSLIWRHEAAHGSAEVLVEVGGKECLGFVLNLLKDCTGNHLTDLLCPNQIQEFLERGKENVKWRLSSKYHHVWVFQQAVVKFAHLELVRDNAHLEILPNNIAFAGLESEYIGRQSIL